MFKPDRPKAIYRQLADYYENEILSGKLKAGDRLPPTSRLVAQFELSIESVQNSLKILAERGLIERTPGRGTFVRRGVGNRTIGVVFDRQVFCRADLRFFGLFGGHFNELAAKDNYQVRSFAVDDGGACDQGFHQLKQAVENGELCGIFEFCAETEVCNYLQNECPIPVMAAVVKIDFLDALCSGFDYFRQIGDRHVALLYPQYSHREIVDVVRRDELIRQYEQAGLTVDLLVIPEAGDINDNTYRILKEYLRRPGRAASLFFMVDSIYNGGIYAILEDGLTVPQDIHLLITVNRELKLFSPLPLTVLEVNSQLTAEQNYLALKAKVEGHKFEFVSQKPRLIAGKSCGESLK